MNLRRIVVIHDKVEARGGATGLARLSAIQYRKLGYKVTYITGAEDDQSLKRYGIEVVAMGHPRMESGISTKTIINGIYNTQSSKRIQEWIAQNDTPDTAYHLHNWAQILSPSVFPALSSVAERTVVSCHDFFNVCPNGGLVNFPKREACSLKPMSAACWSSNCDRRGRGQKMWRMARQVSLNHFANFANSPMSFVCLHEGMEKLMRDAGFAPKNLTSIPNPSVPYTNMRIEAEENESFLYIGRLTEEKGADILIEAARKTDVPVSLAGEGPLRDRLENQHDQASFYGFCTRSELVNHAKTARALVVPGRWREPYGLVVAEAAQSGLPIIISDPSTLSEQVRDLNLGSVFDPSDSNSLAGVLEQFSHDDDLVLETSFNAFTRAHHITTTPMMWAKQFVDLMKQKIGTVIV